ncbi:lytic transglycosylase domain-containing protein [Aquabacterium sp. A7-Y]|uniref:lytic transglycosylase domain-containing protein n=1 Tax=Aquabacterium sp. A7-Y TaxID=1349605 RepID=UPI00223DA327|nr:lytic transglycosylase domain-containing protein [Aquabacterium sp. A7-Y]MCW7539181.1 lytic transglycosylase domain-containing protein [Aquabacterium sp. A7-Y]
MTAWESVRGPVDRAATATVASVAVFFKDVGHGLLEISHNGLAFVGLVVLAGTMFFVSRPDLRHHLEAQTLGWLQARQLARAESSPEAFLASLVEPEAISRATAVDPSELSSQQAAVALWLSRRYRVAPEPVGRLVKEAWHVGKRTGIEPTLILAIMAVESSFNPFAQSTVGAQGLMQVMTRVHDDKYERFGGNHAAFDPVTNLRVGVQVLKECIARAGSLEGGLRYYVGAANLNDDGGYAAKVLSEQTHLRNVAAGRRVPISVPQLLQAVQSAPPAAAPAPLPGSPDMPQTTEASAEQVALIR